MTNDTISDFLIRIKNGYLAKKASVSCPMSKTVKAVADILEKENYIGKTNEGKKEGVKRKIEITLLYQNDQPAKFREVMRISTPGKRVYSPADKIPRILGGKGTVVLSTSKGMMTGEEAQKKGIGGELLFKIW